MIFDWGSLQNNLLRRHFDLLRNTPSTVSTYADECVLLVLTTLVISASLSKNLFFDRLTEVTKVVKTSNTHSSAYVDTVGSEGSAAFGG